MFQERSIKGMKGQIEGLPAESEGFNRRVWENTFKFLLALAQDTFFTGSVLICAMQ